MPGAERPTATTRAAGDQECAGEGVREGDQRDLVGQHGPEVGEFGAAGRRVDAVADRGAASRSWRRG